MCLNDITVLRAMLAERRRESAARRRRKDQGGPAAAPGRGGTQPAGR